MTRSSIPPRPLRGTELSGDTDSRRGSARKTAWLLIAVAFMVYALFVGSAVLK